MGTLLYSGSIVVVVCIRIVQERVRLYRFETALLETNWCERKR